MKYLIIILLFAACADGVPDEPVQATSDTFYNMQVEGLNVARGVSLDTAAQYIAFDNFDDTAYDYYTYWEGGYVVHPGGAAVLSSYLKYKDIMHTRSMMAVRQAKILLDSAARTDSLAKWYISGLAVSAGPSFSIKQVKIQKQ
jgi:hypothetical protein